MSKNIPQKKQAPAAVATPAATIANRAKSVSNLPKEPLLFGRENFKLFGIAVGLILLGMGLMLGGAMPNADTWDPTIIYSFTRITLAPMVILSGLVVAIYAIFKKTAVAEPA